MPKAGPATREQIAMFGHIATALRGYCEKAGISRSDLATSVGLPRSAGNVSHWLNAKGAPSPAFRAKLANVTGIPETDLRARKLGEAPVPSQAVALVPAAAKLAPVRVGDVLSFAVSADGTARLRLDVVLPLATATPLLRMLLDAGIVFGAEEPTGAPI